MSDKIINPSEPEVVSFCPELPAIQSHTVLGQPGFVLQPCIKEQCAKYLPCQVIPKALETFLAAQNKKAALN